MPKKDQLPRASIFSRVQTEQTAQSRAQVIEPHTDTEQRELSQLSVDYTHSHRSKACSMLSPQDIRDREESCFQPVGELDTSSSGLVSGIMGSSSESPAVIGGNAPVLPRPVVRANISIPRLPLNLLDIQPAPATERQHVVNSQTQTRLMTALQNIQADDDTQSSSRASRNRKSY